MEIDLRTLVLFNLVGNFVTLVAMGVLWSQYRTRFRGLGFWFLNTALQVLAIGLLLLRGRVPDWLSMIVANGAALAGQFLLLWGLQRFFQRRLAVTVNAVYWLGFVLLFTYWALIVPNLTVRDLLIAVSIAFSMTQVAWLLLSGDFGELRGTARLMGTVAVGFVAINLARAVVLVLQPHPSNDFYHADNWEAVAMVAYAMMSLFLLLSQILLVTRRLLVDVTRQQEKFNKAFFSSPYAVLMTRVSDGTIFEVNRGFEELTGYSRDEVLGKTTPQLQLWDSDGARTLFLKGLDGEGKVRNVELSFRSKSGERRVGLISVETLDLVDEQCYISCIGDITEQTALRQKLQEAATHDALTGLPNRRLFTDRFQVALSNAVRGGKKLAVLSLDFDKFKPVNDTWGHEVGDAVLVEASRRLSSCLRRVDTVARFGGDEFVLLLWEVEEPGDASQVALKILDRFRVPLAVEGHSIILHASVGISLYPDDGADLSELLRKSDAALYAVKEHGRNNYRFAVQDGPSSPTGR